MIGIIAQVECTMFFLTIVKNITSLSLLVGTTIHIAIVIAFSLLFHINNDETVGMSINVLL